MNDQFTGFSFEKEKLTQIPASFFTQIVPAVDDLASLKIALYVFWWMSQQESNLPYMTLENFSNDDVFMASLGATPKEQLDSLSAGLVNLQERAVLLKATAKISAQETAVFFLNTKKSQAAVEAIAQGNFQVLEPETHPTKLKLEFPNVYALYEENVGPLTPIIADALRELENLYPPDWIEDAINEAVKNNVRKLKYIEAILQNWQTEGRNDRTDRGRSKKSKEEDDPERYIKGKYSDFIDH
jgi:DnaD/phage-associated family protein